MDDFSQELVTLKEDEETSLAQFTELSAAKSAEIKAGTAMVEAKKPGCENTKLFSRSLFS